MTMTQTQTQQPTLDTALTLYNNGIGVFRRGYTVNGKPTQIKLTIPKDATGDLIASIRILGKVTITEPISWPQEDEARLKIDANNAQVSILTGLTGRKIKLTLENKSVVSGVLIGIHTEQKEKSKTTSLSIVKDTYVVVSAGGAISRYLLSDVFSYQFEEQEVQSEIEKSLTQASLELRQDTTFAMFGVTAPDLQIATIQYALPLPAWQPTYRLSISGDLCYFEGLAKIDYTGEEDLLNCHVTLVVGDPDTFSTDLATPVIPTRNTVNLVKAHAEGGHVLEAGLNYEVCGGGGRQASAAPAIAMASMSRRKTVNAESVRFQAAEQPTADTAEIGDFSTWTTSTPLTLRAKQSSLIPLFNSKIKGAEQVLYFNSAVNATRPKSAIQFKNELTQSLGKGVCSVYQENELIGTAVLNSVKSGESIILTYATETGVRALVNTPQHATKIHSIKVHNGVVETSEYSYANTEYQFDNIQKQSYELTVDHARVLHNSTITCSENVKQIELLQTGGRFKGALKSGRTTITIKESRLDKNGIVLHPSNLPSQLLLWQENIPAKTLADNKAVQIIIGMQSELHTKLKEQAHIKNKNAQYEATTVRVMKYLENGEASAEAQKTKWRAELATATDNLSTNEKRLIVIGDEIQALTETLSTHLKSLDLSWTVG